ncbi:MAG: sigma-70 family RNA polymerase sigma factor [Cytophagales bacterium]|nr:sigma-70 family RNA polymerase sigma factor [Cytophagales bacterium]
MFFGISSFIFTSNETRNPLARQITLAEDQLVALLKQHDRKGFEYLYDRYSAALYGVVLRIVRTEEVAEDVVQEAFVKIWKNVAAYDKSKGTLFTWVLNIARNTAIDKVRTQDFKQQASIQDLEQNVSMLDRQANELPQVDFIGMEKHVAQLRPEHRLVVDYLYFKGYTQTELAEELDIPLGTVKTRIKAAINHLRELMGVTVKQ